MSAQQEFQDGLCDQKIDSDANDQNDQDEEAQGRGRQDGFVAAITITFSVGSKAVHLNKNLVERLFTLVVTTANARTTHATDSVDLIYENNSWSGTLRHLEQITHAACADADEHLDELRT